MAAEKIIIYFVANMGQPLLGTRSWYGHWWGKILIGFIVFSSVILVVFAVITAMYWWQIKHGVKPNIGTPSPGSFTASFAPKSSVRVDRSRLETADDPSLGRAGAPVTVVEFIDFKCPNSRAAAPIMDRVIARYGAKVHLIIRDLPVESTHPGATKLSELAYCAGREQRFWPMYQTLFNEQDTLPDVLDDAALQRLAERTGANFESMKTCLASASAFQEVQTDYLAGISAGVRGTPTFFINGEKIEGAIPFEAWERYLEKVK